MEDKIMKEFTIMIGRDFSDTPGGRYPEDGPSNGQRFREEYLIPALKANDKIIVDISGVEGYGSSFLEEVFGGLVRRKLFTKGELESKLVYKASDPCQECYLGRISTYIHEAWGKLK